MWFDAGAGVPQGQNGCVLARALPRHGGRSRARKNTIETEYVDVILSFIDIVQYTYRNQLSFDVRYPIFITLVQVLKYCIDNGCMWNELSCAMAAETGHLEILRWCRANGCPWNELTCSYAAEGGHLGEKTRNSKY